MKMRSAVLASLPLAVIAAAACGHEASDGEELDPENVATSESALEQTLATNTDPNALGREVSITRHLVDGEEYVLSQKALFAHGKRLFTAVWTPQEGGGRPLTKGNGEPLSDPSAPLLFPRNFNRISAMDSNSCASCHNAPFAGGGGHFEIGRASCRDRG